ncbi:hypothetical protein Tco_1510115 [Tanacetum coccineum]
MQTQRSNGSTSLGTNVGVDPAIQKKREYNRSHYQRCKERKIVETNANMQTHTPVGSTQYLSGLTCETTIDDRHGSNILLPLFDHQEYNQTMDGSTQYLSGLTRETTIDDRHGSNILLPLFDQQEYNQTMNGTTVVVDPTFQNKKQYDKSRYQNCKANNISDENADMEARTMKGMTQIFRP